MVSKLNIWSEVSQRTYSPEPRRMVQSVIGDFIFTSRPLAPILFTQELFW